jgi:hypothetical protein
MGVTEIPPIQMAEYTSCHFNRQNQYTDKHYFAENEFEI